MILCQQYKRDPLNASSFSQKKSTYRNLKSNFEKFKIYFSLYQCIRQPADNQQLWREKKLCHINILVVDHINVPNFYTGYYDMF